MKKSVKKVLVVVIILIGLLTIGYNLFVKDWLAEQSAIDRCLDRGGRWNYEEKKCEFE